MSKDTPPTAQAGQHKNDMYGNIDARTENEDGVLPPIPAATVVLLRDGEEGVEILMLRKNSKITFGGMWVFPGGKIDEADFGDEETSPGVRDVDLAARNAAVRETMEEAGIELDAEQFLQFAHWTPPPGPQKRFATWFFLGALERDQEISIDDGEIKEHAWLNPAKALQRHAAGEIDLAPPTWVTLYHMSLYNPVSALRDHFQSHAPKVYATHVAKRADGVRVAMWAGDAGYEPWDADAQGPRHRLVMADSGFVFENDAEQY